MSKSIAFNTTQPPDWVEAFKKAASLEGIDLSQWVGRACISQLFYSEPAHIFERCLEPHELPSRLGLSERTGRGRPPREPQAIPSVSEAQAQGWVGGDGRP